MKIKVNSEKEVLSDPQGWGSWENFNLEADKLGLQIVWEVGNDLDGWWVSAIEENTMVHFRF